MKRFFSALVVVAAAMTSHPQALSQDKYPSKPVRIIVPFAAGGATDVLTRIAAAELSKRLGQSFVIENLTGAGGIIGATQALKATPDGYTLLAGSPGPITIMPVISAKPVPYDAQRDVIPVTLIADSPGAMTVGKNSPYKSVQEVLAAAKSSPGKLSCGSSGIGAFSHLNCELLKSLTGTHIVHIPCSTCRTYKSSTTCGAHKSKAMTPSSSDVPWMSPCSKDVACWTSLWWVSAKRPITPQ